MKAKLALYLLLLTMLGCRDQSDFTDQKNNMVVAHQGAWKTDGLPSNSIASLRKAIALKCYGTEFDVHLTKDDVLVVNHDKDFYGLDIATSTYDELLSKKHPNGESIPKAEAYIREGMKQNQTKLVFELKPSNLGKERALRSADLTVELVKASGADEWVEYILFDYDAAKRIIELDAQAKVFYLNGDVEPSQAKADGFYGLDYNMKVFREHPDWIKTAHELGLAINVWTINEEEEMQHFIDLGADFITTDEPEKLLTLLREKNK
ncbi:glycerophosphodiester phosphodiesterase family protein [Parapedobacter tibetensis]|uniref:glycerophosphodiester phosphodiesterase family protein n=1 Tax=Parapedobacter tibetensis TaxID=2972951 RepID=UPI00214DA425|nr:glycerophosphodiester phosphodiesterase family protein [Parapedobacter tibetensis]